MPSALMVLLQKNNTLPYTGKEVIQHKHQILQIFQTTYDCLYFYFFLLLPTFHGRAGSFWGFLFIILKFGNVVDIAWGCERKLFDIPEITHIQGEIDYCQMTLSESSAFFSAKQNEKLIQLLAIKKNEGQVWFAFCRTQEVNLCTQNVLQQTVLISELTDDTKRKEYYQCTIHLSSKTDGEQKLCQIL